jgi:hypothetical protein
MLSGDSGVIASQGADAGGVRPSVDIMANAERSIVPLR